MPAEAWRAQVLAKVSRESGRLAVTPLTLFGPGDPISLSLWQRPYQAQKPQRDCLARLRPGTGKQFVRTPRTDPGQFVCRSLRRACRA